jgi:hypothetical protein
VRVAVDAAAHLHELCTQVDEASSEQS